MEECQQQFPINSTTGDTVGVHCAFMKLSTKTSWRLRSLMGFCSTSSWWMDGRIPMYFWPKARTWASMLCVSYGRQNQLWKPRKFQELSLASNISTDRGELTSCSSKGTLSSFSL